ncbi:acyl-CoA thioesterase II [Blastococcus sp. Marseille-P5729]|uniref:acyl-CoA thioesterase n=1 Tax=Blastococcus sp. Marseille-P5729 TaxID=2086582 RepID=UPI000D0F39C0|nr:acyl-CoA thioesterase domain-containing protein [Blastococcus sp. Marseille-P5729]
MDQPKEDAVSSTEPNPAAAWDPTVDLNDLLEAFTLERIDPDCYRANYVVDDPKPLYGGQVVAQCLIAACRTVDDDRLPHSLHGYFLRGGAAQEPVLLHVSRDFDGRSFASRRVVAKQDGKVVFSCTMSFARQSDGPDHQTAESPGWDVERLHEFPSGRLQSMQMRALVPFELGQRLPRKFAARFTADLGDDPVLHLASLAYLSDTSSGLAEIQGKDVGYLSSIDHSVWLHQIPDMTQWHLVELEPRCTGAGRGLFTGGIFDQAGRLIASTAQESLFRYRRQ